MAQLTSTMMTVNDRTATATAARSVEQRRSSQAGNEARGAGNGFESMAELGGWMRTAFLGVFAPELLLEEINDARAAEAAGSALHRRGETIVTRL